MPCPAVEFGLQPGAAEIEFGKALSEYLGVVEGAVQRKLGPLAILGERVEIQHRQALFRAGLRKGTVIRGDQSREPLAGDLRHQRQCARLLGRRRQGGAERDAWHVGGQQQPALQRGGVDWPLFGQVVEKAQHLRAGGADIPLQLDVGDPALDDDEAQRPARDDDVDDSVDIPVMAIEIDDAGTRGLDAALRDRRAGQPGGEFGDLLGRVGGDALDRNGGDVVQDPRPFRRARYGRGRRQAGGNAGGRAGHHLRDGRGQARQGDLRDRGRAKHRPDRQGANGQRSPHRGGSIWH